MRPAAFVLATAVAIAIAPAVANADPVEALPPIDSFRLTPAPGARRQSYELEALTGSGDFLFIGRLESYSLSAVAAMHVPKGRFLISAAAGVQAWSETRGDALHHEDTSAMRLANLTVTGTRWYGTGPLRYSLGARGVLPLAGRDALPIHEVRGLGYEQMSPGVFGAALVAGVRFDGARTFLQAEARAAAYVVRDYYYHSALDGHIALGVATGVRLTDRVHLLAEGDVVDGMERGPRITAAAGFGAHVGPGEIALRIEARILGPFDLGGGGVTADRAGGMALRYAQPY